MSIIKNRRYCLLKLINLINFGKLNKPIKIYEKNNSHAVTISDSYFM